MIKPPILGSAVAMRACAISYRHVAVSRSAGSACVIVLSKDCTEVRASRAPVIGKRERHHCGRFVEAGGIGMSEDPKVVSEEPPEEPRPGHH